MSGLTSQQEEDDDDEEEEEEDVSHDGTHQRRSPGQSSHDSGISVLGSSDSCSSQDSLLVTCLDDATETKLSKGQNNSKTIRSSALKTSQVPRKIRRVRWADLAVTETSVCMTEDVPVSDLQLDPVTDWLKDLRSFYRPECTCALQHKSIIIHQPDFDDSMEKQPYTRAYSSIYRRTQKAHAEVSRLQKGAHGISTKFAELCLSVEKKDKETLVRVLRQLLGRLMPFLRQAESSSEDIKADLETVRQSCAVLLQSVIFDEAEWGQIRQLVAVVGHYFVSCVDKLVRSETRVLSDALQSSDAGAVRLAARSLPSIGGDFASDCVESLILALKRPEMEEIWTDIITCLTHLCSASTNVHQFEKVDGFRTVCDILCKRSAGSSEAVGLLAQITTFWTINSEDSDFQYDVYLAEFQFNRLLCTLKDLLLERVSSEDLLLIAAILSNLTSVLPDITVPVIESHMLGILAAALGNDSPLNLFIYERVIAMMAHIASVSLLHGELVAQRGLDVTAKFLQLESQYPESSAEARAWNRALSSTLQLLEKLAAGDQTVRRAVADSEVLPLLSAMLDYDERENFRTLAFRFKRVSFFHDEERSGMVPKIPRVSAIILS